MRKNIRPQDLIETFPQRLEALIAAKGGSSKYWLMTKEKKMLGAGGSLISFLFLCLTQKIFCNKVFYVKH